MNRMDNDKKLLDEELYKLVSALVKDADGHFYRWESEDLVQARTITQMTVTELRDFVSPVISFIQHSSQVIFGLRFAFTPTNPVTWQKSPAVRQAMKDLNVTVSVSNSKSTSGKLVTAGNILLKAPNTTHLHRYTQYLRGKVSDVTPYFDIFRAAKTPMDQIIPHLVVQCGEKHVTPLCQSLLKSLTGRGTALFLPRYAFSTMSELQITQHFQFHEKWLKSLCPISLTPTVTHLDQPRIEYCEDGTTIERSVRDWVSSLKRTDGTTPALCDVVNGTSDRKAYLVVPRHFIDEATHHWRQYRLRLFPPRHREARYRDSVSGLPDVIHITTSIQSNISFLEEIANTSVWTQIPPTVADATADEQKHAQSAGLPFRSTRSRSQASRSTTSDNTPRTSDVEDSSTSPNVPLPVSYARATASAVTFDEDRSTDSTQSLTRGSANHYQARFHEIEAIMKRQQKALDSSGKVTSERISTIERQLYRFDDFDTKLAAVSTQMTRADLQQQKLESCLQELQVQSRVAQRQNQEFQEQSDQKIDKLGDTVVIAMQTMLDIRQQFATMSGFMQELANQKSPRKKKQRSTPDTSESTGSTTHVSLMEDLNEEMTEEETMYSVSGGINLDPIASHQYEGHAEHILVSGRHCDTSPLRPQRSQITTLTSLTANQASKAHLNLQYNATDSDEAQES